MDVDELIEKGCDDAKRGENNYYLNLSVAAVAYGLFAIAKAISLNKKEE